ncbi:haloacid dehalogenase-like hydrolase [Candidatus Magnetoovum chiemensis]|nr:haloacid dehalogenase-like hydrolase [Candidatus Magnetoovum chiemensis]
MKAIIFDFDGVLVESAKIKTDAFRKLFSKCTEHVDEIVNYHMKNMGISRYVKFRYFYENILKQPYSTIEGEALSREFSSLVLDGIEKAPLVTGTEAFLEFAADKYLLFIASGTPQEELEHIVSHKKLKKYFTEIKGSPLTKPQIIDIIITKYSVSKNETLFVGDAESDLNAARNTGIHFILRATPDNQELKTSFFINDLTELKDCMTRI